MFELRDSWVWDFWFAEDGDTHHLFFLYASRALHDPDRRHYRASVGHAVSTDLVNWERIEDALVRADVPAWDDLATWTGSVVRDEGGTWNLFYTGATLSGTSNVQRIGRATSTDLVTWERVEGNPVLWADPALYETRDGGLWHDEAFRDPWVFQDPGGAGWHMLVTARSPHGEAFDRGVVGHAWSPDLGDWELREPLSEPGSGFGHLEVTQVEEVGGQHVLVFSCMAEHMAPWRRGEGTGGIWVAPAAGPLGPFDIRAAYPLTDSRLYSGKLVRGRDGGWYLMGFVHDGPDGHFVGAVSDPMPVGWEDGRLVVLTRP